MMSRYTVCIKYLLCIITAYSVLTKTDDDLLQTANSYFKQKKFQEAVVAYRTILVQNPVHHHALLNLGISLVELEKYSEAEQVLKQLTSQQPLHASAYLHLGTIAKKNKKSAEAFEYFKQAVTLDPKSKEAAYAFTEELKDKLQIQEAVECLRVAVGYHPNDINLEFTLANTLNMGGHVEEALSIYHKLNAKYPNDAGIIYNIAFTYKKIGDMTKALPFYEKAIGIKSNHTEALFSRGLAYLVTGDWEKGWEGYEHRWTRSEHLRIRAYDKPIWQGEDLQGKTIFVCAEQGLGDTFQFIRYLKELKRQGAHVVFAPQRPLMTIMKLCPYIDELVSLSEKPAHFDYHIPLVSLPYSMKTRIESVPHEIPYLYADEQLVEEWRIKLAHDPNIKVGICWQGNSEYNTAFLRAAVAGKSMPMTHFEPLTHIPGVSIYSLQHMTGMDQLNSIPSTMKLIMFNELDTVHGRFMDTAAIIKNFDLIITVDTSICHLAAGLGTLVWNLLPNPPDWRWMLECSDTPWYPNMRLFRQPTPGDWHTVIEQVVQELIHFVSDKGEFPLEFLQLMTHYRNTHASFARLKQESIEHNMSIFLNQEIVLLEKKIALLSQLYDESNHA